MKRRIFASTMVVSGILGSANAATIASTTFDGQTITANTASALGWTLAGVEDPGSMSAFVADTTNTQNLFNTNTFNQNLFAPSLNVGNTGSFWRTTVSLTVSAGSTVALTDVAFDSWAISGGGVQNVNRRSDFTITLFDPSAVAVPGGSVSVLDVFNGATAGTATPVSLVFASPIALTAPGTYILQIDGGELGGVDETGNHTGIDNLFINGNVSAIPEPSTALLSALASVCLVSTRRRK